MTTQEVELPLWVEDPGTDEWIGFRQSAEPNDYGTYYAQCKACTEIIDAVIDDMKLHRESCPSLNDQSKVKFYFNSIVIPLLILSTFYSQGWREHLL